MSCAETGHLSALRHGSDFVVNGCVNLYFDSRQQLGEVSNLYPDSQEETHKEPASNDPDLVRIVANWSKLPLYTKQSIAVLVNG